MNSERKHSDKMLKQRENIIFLHGFGFKGKIEKFYNILKHLFYIPMDNGKYRRLGNEDTILTFICLNFDMPFSSYMSTIPIFYAHNLLSSISLFSGSHESKRV